MLAGWCGVGALLALVSLLMLTVVREPFYRASLIGAACLTVSAFLHAGDRRNLLLLAVLLPLAVRLMGFANAALVCLSPHTMDSTMLRLDHGVSVRIYHWALAHHTLTRPLRFVYAALPLFTALILGAVPQRMRCACAMTLAGAFGLMFYVLFPAVGPAHLADVRAARNCMPSLHVTWALLLVLHSSPRLRPVTLVYALLTIVATLTTGEHYLLDLVAAGPYSAAIFYGMRANLLRRVVRQTAGADLRIEQAFAGNK